MTETTIPAAPDRQAAAGASDRVLGGVIITLMALELLARMTGGAVVQRLAWLALAGVVLASIRRIGLREVYLLAFCGGMSLLALKFHPAPLQAITAGLSQASFLMAFVLLLGLLHEAAATSPSVSALGRFLSRQPSQRRFYALFGGTSVMSMLFNLGVVSLLVPLIQRGIREGTPDDPLNPVRERRQISALLRGFAWSVIWSPTAIAPLALLDLIPGINRQLWILLGLALAMVFMVMGASEDALRWRAYRPRAKQPNPAFPKQAGLMFALACTWLLGFSMLISRQLGDTIIFGLMVVCPAMLLGWVIVQNQVRGRVAWRAVGTRLQEIGFRGLPASARVAVTLGCSGFIGRVASALVPSQAVAEALHLEQLPDFLLLSALPPILALISLLGLSPIMTSVFFGGFFGKLPELPADPTLIALAISMGWSMSMLLSPLATVVLLINRGGAIPTTTLTWGWNLLYGLLCGVAVLPIFAVLTWAVGP